MYSFMRPMERPSGPNYRKATLENPQDFLAQERESNQRPRDSSMGWNTHFACGSPGTSAGTTWFPRTSGN